MFTAHSPTVEREARDKSERLREWGGVLGFRGIVTYMAPEITAAGRHDTGFCLPQQNPISRQPAFKMTATCAGVVE